MSPIKRYLIVGAALGLGLGVAFYPLSKYTMSYTLLPVQDRPALRATLPSNMGTPRTLTARVSYPVSLDAYIDAFYSCWTLKTEGWAATQVGHKTTFPPNAQPNGIPHARGLFTEIYRDKDNAMVWWGIDAMAGAQILSVTPVDGGTEIAYTCLEVNGDSPSFSLLAPVHLFYMRFLFHHVNKVLGRGV